MKIHHIGYLVKKMDRSISAFRNLGFEVEADTVEDTFRGINICFMVKDGYRVELVCPNSKESVVYDLQKKYGNSPYHICYICDDMQTEIKELRSKGYVAFNEPHEAVALGYQLVCFLIHPYLGMIELLEEKS